MTSADDTINRQHVVYRFYDAAGTLLYVGMTADLPGRMRSHAADKPWWPHVVRTESDAYPNRREAEAAEMVAIITGRPLHNKAMNYGDLRSLILMQERGKAYRMAAAVGVGMWLFIAWTLLMSVAAAVAAVVVDSATAPFAVVTIWFAVVVMVGMSWDEIGPSVKKVVLA